MAKEHSNPGFTGADSRTYGGGTHNPAMTFARRHTLLLVAAILALAAAVFWLAGQAFVSNPSITVEKVWARPAGVGENSAAYMVIKNERDEPVKLVGTASDIAMKVEIHQTSMGQANVMHMEQVQSVDIPSGAEVELKPGGLHVMLMGLERELVVGESFTVTLEFDGADPQELNVPVNEPAQ